MDLFVVTIDTFVLAGYVGVVLAFLGVVWGIRRLIKLGNYS